MPNLRTGDVVELAMFSSLSEAKVTTLEGLVFGRSKPNNLRSTMWFQSVADSVSFSYKVKLYSPMVARLKVLKYGSNRNRKKLNHIPKLDLTATGLQEPIIRGKGFKPRARVASRSKSKQQKRARAEEGSVKKLVVSELDE